MSNYYDSIRCVYYFVLQAEDGIRDLVRSRGLGDVYKRQAQREADSEQKHIHSEGASDIRFVNIHKKIDR